MLRCYQTLRWRLMRPSFQSFLWLQFHLSLRLLLMLRWLQRHQLFQIHMLL